MDDDDATVNTASSRVFHADSLVARQTNTSRGSSPNEWHFFFGLPRPIYGPSLKRFVGISPAEFISAVSLYLFLSPFFLFFSFFLYFYLLFLDKRINLFVGGDVKNK